jgi:hypothetical protein
MRTCLFIAGCLMWLPLACAATAAQRSLSVTIYNGDLALVQDRRDVEVSNARRSEIQFELRRQLPDGGRVVRADHAMGEKNGRPIFRLTLPPNDTMTPRYQAQRANG